MKRLILKPFHSLCFLLLICANVFASDITFRVNVKTVDDDLHIGAASPAINGGAPSDLFPFLPGVDRSGVARPKGAGNDIGADETD
jgi:hypothetical protein